MIRKLLLISLSVICLPAFPQGFHSLDTLLEIVENSSLSYEMHELKEAILPEDRSEILNYNTVYRIKGDDGLKLDNYHLSELGQDYFKKAEAHFSHGEIEEARNMYVKVLENDPGYYRVMSYIGQTYGIQQEYDKAIAWYKKVIANNYIDYMAHWYLADIYRDLGDLDEAVREITIAQVLNRNNLRIAASLKGIYTERRLKTEAWSFTPQMKIVHAKKEIISLDFAPAWMGYCIAKAVWEFEPGYKEFMGVDKDIYTIFEEKEAIISLYQGACADKKNFREQPFKALLKAIDNELLDEFIIYEIMLVKYPNLAYNLPEDLINIIADYVILVRGGKKI